ILVLFTGCQRPGAPPASAVSGPASPAGWEIRYNAALALARRGSPHVKEPEVWDSLTEMLDEDQQLRNFHSKTDDGREVTDETGARTTVIGALQAVQELHRKQPQMDLSGLKEPIEKLTHGPNSTVAVQARQARLALFGASPSASR
ncbi:MAG TPA: hypothetical protein VH120_08585, partial [Gemmataceae bacterium]|nr:hypothetical protein [Gemmataceae bacterium]